jgi:hypothetical protein
MGLSLSSACFVDACGAQAATYRKSEADPFVPKTRSAEGGRPA